MDLTLIRDKPNIIVQIYEVQNPDEAEDMVEIGVDHIGSVILSEDNWKIPEIKQTIDLISKTSSKSCLIPLFSSRDSVFAALDFYKPDIVHFCEDISGIFNGSININTLIEQQNIVKERFPEIKIMRSVPIAPPGMASRVPTIKLAKMFEYASDYFLTDTLLINRSQTIIKNQPVDNFIGITGQTCDWGMAAKLVESSSIPVILAGGVSPKNVFDGIMHVYPAGVDSCTNTNALDKNGRPIRFKKDKKSVKLLIKEVQRAKRYLKKQED